MNSERVRVMTLTNQEYYLVDGGRIYFRSTLSVRVGIFGGMAGACRARLLG